MVSNRKGRYILHLKDSRRQRAEGGGGGRGEDTLGRGNNKGQVVGEGRGHFQWPVDYVTDL